jgi:hypothetical protein
MTIIRILLVNFATIVAALTLPFVHGFSSLVPAASIRSTADRWLKQDNTILAQSTIQVQSPSVNRRFMVLDSMNDNDDSDDDDDEMLGKLSKPPMEEGTADELMYALGVNLARQLGDITPLVENGQELAQVAKGILDTIVGRLTQDGQRDLLLRRGTELNAMITERA